MLACLTILNVFNLFALLIIPILFIGILLLTSTYSYKSWLSKWRLNYNLNIIRLNDLNIYSFWDYIKCRNLNKVQLKYDYWEYKDNLYKRLGIFSSLILYLLIIIYWLKFNRTTVSYQLISNLGNNPNEIWNLDITLGMDGVSLPFILLVGFIMPLVYLSNWTTIDRLTIYYIIIIVLLELFLIIVFLVLDLIMFYVFFESTLPLLFIMIGLWGSSQKFRAGYYLFLYTLLGSLFMLVVFVKMYSDTGSAALFDNYNIINIFHSLNLQDLIWLILFGSFAVKTPLVPVHIWLPLAHSDANVSGSIILASIVLKLALYAFIRILLGIFYFATTHLIPFFLGFCCMSLVYSSLTTIRQFDLKVLVAYSSVAVRRMVFSSYEYLNILPVSIFGTDNQLISKGKPLVEHSMLIKRVIGNETASSINYSVIFSMIRPKLVQVQYLFAYCSRLQFSCILLYIFCIYYLGNIIYKTIINKSKGFTLIKDMSERSKENSITIINTTGIPKVFSDYGIRNFEVHRLSFSRFDNRLYSNSIRSFWNINYNIYGKKLVCILNSYKFYSSRATFDKLTDLNKRSKLKPDLIIDINLYTNFILNKEMFILAFNNLNFTTSELLNIYDSKRHYTNPNDKSGKYCKLYRLDMNIVDDLIVKLSNESFNFTSSSFDRYDLKYFDIDYLRDSLVQEILRMVLEAIYEPLFKDDSHGFRVDRGRYTALNSVYNMFPNTTWCFSNFNDNDNIYHFQSMVNENKLIDLLSIKIKDKKFIRLLCKAIKTVGKSKVNYLYTNFKWSNVRYPYSILSPILINIYLDQLDNYVVTLKNNNKLVYVRYAHLWIVGIDSTYNEAKSILNKIIYYCDTIGLILNNSKIKIINIKKGKVLFIDVEIRYNKVDNNIIILAPIRNIINLLTISGFLKFGKSYPKFKWLSYNHNHIIHLYNEVFVDILNYYTNFNNRSKKVAKVLSFFLKGSCAKLLAAKYSLKTQAQVYKKYGKHFFNLPKN
jgi:Proton-conducting membrane transporter/Type II intron maturase